jgi:hypothetical protein
MDRQTDRQNLGKYLDIVNYKRLNKLKEMQVLSKKGEALP